MSGETVVVIDSLADPADTLGLAEAWLHGADVDTDEQADTIEAGMRAAAAMSVALDAAFSVAPTLYAPASRLELAPVAVVSFDVAGVVQTVRRAAAEAAGTPHPPPTLAASVDLLAACAAAAGSADTTILAEVGCPGPATISLDDRQYRSYRRFASAVLTNPLDRFIALSADTSPADPAADLSELLDLFGDGLDL